VLKVNYYRLTRHLSFEAFACVEVWPLGHDGSVLLSVVAHALLCNFFVHRFLLLSPPVMPMKAVSGNSKLLSAAFCTGAHRRCRVVEEGFHL
jgi:hypothetical protein